MELTPKIERALAVASRYPIDLAHVRHVARLADLLFGVFQPLHGLGERKRELLACAALLHDIGVSAGASGHHLSSLRLILEADLSPLSGEEKLVVANVARYHRKAHPSPKHEPFAALPPGDQEIVRRLAALLRVADGLDRAHENAVERLAAAPGSADSWTLSIDGPGDLELAASGAARKADLFEEVYGRSLRVEWARRPAP